MWSWISDSKSLRIFGQLLSSPKEQVESEENQSANDSNELEDVEELLKLTVDK